MANAEDKKAIFTLLGTKAFANDAISTELQLNTMR